MGQLLPVLSRIVLVFSSMLSELGISRSTVILAMGRGSACMYLATIIFALNIICFIVLLGLNT